MKSTYFLLYAILISMCACKKDLETKSSLSLSVPTTVNDYQGLMDNASIMNGSYTGLGDLGCDTYYLSYAAWQAIPAQSQQAYIWGQDIFQGGTSPEWNNQYRQIYFANLVITGLPSIPVTSTNQADWNTAMGTAKFFRAFCLYQLEETFGQPYRPTSASTDLGVPVKLNPNLSEKSVRSTVAEVYQQIITDLMVARTAVPLQVDMLHRSRVFKPAVYAMLSRVYLSMQDYTRAGLYADSCLQIYSTLTDWNSLSSTSSRPFPVAPNEFGDIIFDVRQQNYSANSGTTTAIDTTLLNSYSDNDLRKTIYFALNATSNTKYFKGQYEGEIYFFQGLATDEVYLTRAECNARAGNTIPAMSDLNTMLQKRWKAGVTYVPLTAGNADIALVQILNERKKELVFRGIRWNDLRRLNQDSRFAVTLTRILNGQTYTLPPNDPKYTYPIPPDEIILSGIPQNPR